MKIQIAIALAAALICAGAQVPANVGAPEAAFRTPDCAKRPETYFFFFGGNVAAPGITADLEAVKDAGISGIKLFNGASGRGAWPGVPNQITCLSPEWDALIGHFGDECKRLGLRMAMQVCPGWAMAGGPWIKPEQAMRHLAMSRTDVEGANERFRLGFKTVRVKLPQPPRTDADWQDYRDIAVVAFPAPEGDWAKPLAPASVTGGAGMDMDWNAWARGRGGPARIPADATTEITYEFAKPVTVRTLEMPSVRSLAAVTLSFEPRTTVSLVAMSDTLGGPRSGAAADGIEPVPPNVITLLEETALPPSSWQDGSTFSLACRETTARRFTLTVKNKHPIALHAVRLLSAAKKDNWEGEACWTLRSLLRRETPEQSKSAYVKSASVINLTSEMAKDGTLTWDAPPGRWAVLRIGHVNTGVKNIPAPPEGTGFECDKMSTAAADVQFDNYIGRLTKPGAPLHGKLRAMLMDSWECKQQTWTPGMDGIFASRLGYDLFTWIPAVFGYVVDSPDDTARFLDDWRTLVSDLITDDFFGHMSKRAHERGMEVEFEAAFGNSAPGDIMKYYKYADVPMCEFWQPAVSFNFTPVKPIISAAHLYGKRGVGAEAFTSFRVNWGERLRDYKHNANMNLAEGITHFVFHTFTHNPQQPWMPPGTSFGGRGIGAPFVRGQTWWRHMSAFTDYFARCQTMLEAGVPVVDVLWYLGDECDGRPDHYAPFPAGHKYDYCNPDAFLTRITVKGGKWCTPEGIEYGILWIPELRRMLPETMEHLIKGIEKGGVAAMARLPDEPATRKDGEDGARRFAAACEKLEEMIWKGSSGRAHSPSTSHGRVAPVATTTGKMPVVPVMGRLYVGKPIGDVLTAENIEPDVYGEGIIWNHRRSGDDDWYFIAPAKEGEGFDGEVAFRSASGRRAEIWHPENGRATCPQAAGRRVEDNAPYQSAAGHIPQPQAVREADALAGVRVEDNAPCQITALWRISFPAGFGMPTNMTVAALAPWKELGPTPEAKAFSGTATYETEFDLASIASGSRTVLDLGRVESIAKVTVNGKTFPAMWAPPYSVDVTDAVRPGMNHLKIEVTDTWFNRMVYDSGRPEGERRTWAFRRPRKTEPLRDSGLLGPVLLISIP